jgi:ATP-dependent RNA helicase DDX19/DBP5
MTLPHHDLTVEGIRQLYMDCASENDKYDVLVRLYGLMNIGSSVIFVGVWAFTFKSMSTKTDC